MQRFFEHTSNDFLLFSHNSIRSLSLMMIELSMLILGVEIWNCTIEILAFSTFVGPPLAVLGLHLLKTYPSINLVSSIVYPTFLTILISLKSMLVAVLLAVGWTTFIFWRIVALSLIIKVYPRPSLIISSMPLGPKLALIQSSTARI